MCEVIYNVASCSCMYGSSTQLNAVYDITKRILRQSHKWHATNTTQESMINCHTHVTCVLKDLQVWGRARKIRKQWWVRTRVTIRPGLGILLSTDMHWSVLLCLAPVLYYPVLLCHTPVSLRTCRSPEPKAQCVGSTLFVSMVKFVVHCLDRCNLCCCCCLPLLGLRPISLLNLQAASSYQP